MKRAVHGAILGFAVLFLLCNIFVIDYNCRANPGLIIVPDDFPTIQEAIDNATSGDIVFVRAGTYSESPVLLGASYIQLAGESSTTTIVNGAISTRYCSNIVIYGFQFLGSADFGNFGTNHLIEDNVFHSGVTLRGQFHNFSYNIVYGGLNFAWDPHSGPYDFHILGNTFIGDGIDMGTAMYMTIEGNTIVNASIGIREEQGRHDATDTGSHYNVYVRNSISSCGIGLYFELTYDPFWSHSSWCQVQENTFSGNTYGIYTYWVDDLTIYHNNFVSNTAHFLADYTGWPLPYSVDNSLDGGYPLGGNYWSGYTGSDFFRGVFQNETGSDGIGDTAYVIDMNHTDHYPLMGYVGTATPIGENVTVFPSPDVIVTYKTVLNAGLTTATRTDVGPSPPTGRQRLDKLYEIQTTASISGKITIKIIYLDENLTSEEESSLQLAHWMLQGDITGPTGVPDGVVDIRDIALIAVHFGQDVPPAPPNCDVTGPTPNVPDGKIDIRDIALAAVNFGNNQPEWINITTHLDTENNIIFGETSHLSIFGVHFR